MSIKLQLPKVTDLSPRLLVVGVGGAGGNAVNNMIAAGLTGVDFVVANTDAQALLASSAEHRIQLGVNLTEGLGAGSKPEVGEAAAEEAIEEIRARVTGAHMVFVAAGMGGGTGSGAAAVVARVAKEEGVLVVGIVTKPFQFEGTRRMRIAEAGVAELKKHVDTLIVIPNQNLFRIANERTTFAEAFVLADQVLYSGISCIVDLIVKEGLINLDFADVRTILSGMGSAMMGTGEASGERRAVVAAEEAISNPLLDEVSLKGAKGLLLSIIGGRNLTLYEVDEAASRVRQEVDPEANIIVGATFDDSLGERVRVAIVASGMLKAADATGHPASQLTARTAGPTTSGPMPPALPAAGAAPLAAYPHAHQQPAYAPHSAHPQVAAHYAPASALRPSSDDEELARRLSAVMAEDAARPPDYEIDSRPDTSSTIAGAPWQAPGGVYIEEGPPRLSPAPQHIADRSRPAAEPPMTGHPTSPFVAAAPSELPRPMGRRMPELKDFPAVGQRDYRAKTDQQGAPRTATWHDRAGTDDAARDTPRKPGLFERLAGLARRGNDSPASPPESRERINPPSPVAPQQRDSAEPARQAHPQKSASAPDRAPARRVSRGAQSSDLPVFFSKDGR